jgi:hypothetical protein
MLGYKFLHGVFLLSSMHNYSMHMRRVSKFRYCVSSDRHVGRYSMHNDGTVSRREHRKTNNCIEYGVPTTKN